MRVVRIILAIVSLLLPCGAYAQEKPILDQVRDIVTSNNGTVHKWVTPPRITVIHDGESYEAEIDALVEELNTRVDGFPGAEVTFFDLNWIEGAVFGRSHFLIEKVEENGILVNEGRLHIGGNSGSARTVGNIFFFLTDLKTGVLFGEMFAIDEDVHTRRRFVEDTADSTCYLHVTSIDDEIQFAWIYVNSGAEPDLVRHCIHEELTQTLGLMHDTDWSSVFTYNDFTGPAPNTDADFDLLNALYSENVSPGDSPERVIEEFVRITGEGR